MIAKIQWALSEVVKHTEIVVCLYLVAATIRNPEHLGANMLMGFVLINGWRVSRLQELLQRHFPDNVVIISQEIERASCYLAKEDIPSGHYVRLNKEGQVVSAGKAPEPREGVSDA